MYLARLEVVKHRSRIAEQESSKDGLDFSVEGDVRDRLSADGELCAAGIGEMEEAADVIVLVVAGEEALGFSGRELESGESDGLAEFTSERAVAADQFGERHHGCASRSFRGHGGISISEVV
jgi:hypothetical protein